MDRLVLGIAVLFCAVLRVACYDLVDEYKGSSFFDRWDFFGNYDNLTLGDVWWLGRQSAFSQGLAYVNGAGNAILKVDNMHNVPYNEKRNSVRITTQKDYDVGSLWIIDALHIPFGCSVWPAFWTVGPNWPQDGEIDIIEGINVMPFNQMALHTSPGCHHPPENEQYQISQTLLTDCSDPAGCTVLEVQENSFYTGFAAAGGGVWATQFDVAGYAVASIWFWSRSNVPAGIAASNSTSPLDISSWGPPTASYPATYCNITEFFSRQKLVLDITLCGKWAGLTEQYFPTCGSQGPTGQCYQDQVVGSGDNYNDAYFEINSIRAYTTGGPVPTAAALPAIETHRIPTEVVFSMLSPATQTERPMFFDGTTRDGFSWALVGAGLVGTLMALELCR
ncbi:glycoside hydrolase family 16 protein [Cylindrobasidium torrendii FP15055 ss-10]|uniref:Glycoside hydrolase family 16 protein n=1 Tax=Cylindrobasidium torrendii FP15055 ss-10 TaxID=1314674 RepID=A0A0D7BL41_9AGAR|nr:glycoside hydrolase family 16 protein [Cylindrobasidium torrendii FP15055 ss-10]